MSVGVDTLLRAFYSCPSRCSPNTLVQTLRLGPYLDTQLTRRKQFSFSDVVQFAGPGSSKKDEKEQEYYSGEDEVIGSGDEDQEGEEEEIDVSVTSYWAQKFEDFQYLVKEELSKIQIMNFKLTEQLQELKTTSKTKYNELKATYDEEHKLYEQLLKETKAAAATAAKKSKEQEQKTKSTPTLPPPKPNTKKVNKPEETEEDSEEEDENDEGEPEPEEEQQQEEITGGFKQGDVPKIQKCSICDKDLTPKIRPNRYCRHFVRKGKKKLLCSKPSKIESQETGEDVCEQHYNQHKFVK